MVTETKGVSFTKMERHCKDHLQNDQKVCYCDVTGETCNSYGCPRKGRGDRFEN